MPIDVTAASFDQEVLKSQVPVLVDFWATYCPPCKQLAPELEQLAQEVEGRFKIAKVNAPEEADLALRYRISAVPTLLFFQGGKVVQRLVGYHPRHLLRATLEAAA